MQSSNSNLIHKTQEELESTTQQSRTIDPLHIDAIVIKRNGSRVPFKGLAIKDAIEKAFRAYRQTKLEDNLDPFSSREVESISREVVRRIELQLPENKEIGIEQIQDLVEITLMQEGHYSVAKGYILYREERSKARPQTP